MTHILPVDWIFASPERASFSLLFEIFVVAMWKAKATESHRVKYWEIIADNLSKAGWSWGWVLALDRDGRTIFVADAHRDGRKAFRYACG